MFRLSRHQECIALSSVFQGRICQQLIDRPARSYKEGEIIYNIGDAARSIYYIRRGLVKLTGLSEEGKEVILSVYKSGEIFGEFCLCEGERREMATAMELCEIVEIKFEELIERLQTNRDAMYLFLVTVCQRLADSYQVIRELSLDTLMVRVAKALLRLADRFGNETERGTELAHYITQEELAQMVAARREVVSLALNRLREYGLVEYNRKGKMTIKRPALVAFIEGRVQET